MTDQPLVTIAVRLPNGNDLVEAVTATGSTVLWLMVPLCDHCEAQAVHGSIATATHERLGPLPESWWRRIRETPIRCGRPRGDGKPCRTPVTHNNAACRRHESPAAAALRLLTDTLGATEIIAGPTT